MLCGSSLVLLGPPAASRWARRVGALCAAAATLIAGLALFEYVASSDVGFGLPGNGPAEHPSPQTSTALLLAGTALLMLDLQIARDGGLAQILALVSGSIPTVALLGHAFGVPVLYGLPILHPHDGMAVQAAAALIVLTWGILAARPDVGPLSVLTSEHSGGVIARRLLLGLLAFVPVAFLVILGRRLNLYAEPVVSALLVFFALLEGVSFICLTAVRLDADDLARKAVEARLRDSERRCRELSDAD